MKELLVEGQNDLHVFSAIFCKYKIEENFEINAVGSVQEILKGTPVRLKVGNGIDAFGIVVDADTDLDKRWRQISSILEAGGYDVPEKLSENGIILNKKKGSKVGVWIMPDNLKTGMLEDFIKVLIPEDDLLINEVESSLANIEAKKLNKYKDIHKTKAKIHTWLAWQEDPGTPMGLAISKSYLDTNQELCKQFVDWVNRLFND